MRIENFKGIAPAIKSHLLPANYAQTAVNCDFNKGTIRPIADLNTKATFTAPGALRSLYKYDSIWLYWTESDINALRLQLAASDDRVMYTGDGYPKQVDSKLMAASGIPTVDAATITNITKANPAVVTAAAHGFSNADVVGIHSVGGMVQINGKNFTVANKTDDTFELTGIDSRTYTAYTSGGEAVKARDHRRVGIPAPTIAPTVNTGFTGDGVIKYTVAYVYTYVVKWSDGTEEESPPSPVSEILEVEGNDYVTVTATGDYLPTLLAGGNNITHVRIYRTATTTEGAVYRRVKMRDVNAAQTVLFWYDIPVAYWYDGGTNTLYDSDGTTGDIWDNSDDAAIETTLWANPPTDLAGLVQYQHGILAGFSGRDVCVCEPFVHYAWPLSYRVEVDFDPIALGVTNNALVVGTKAFPYIIYGTNASTLGKIVLPYPQRCLAARGLVSTEVGVIYVCPDGLFKINFNEAWSGTLVTEGLIDKADWEALPPTGKTLADIQAYYYDGMYIGIFAGTDDGFVCNFKKDPYFKTIQIVKNVYHGVIDEEDDDLILLTNIGGVNYYADEFNRSTSDLTFKWKSKEFKTPRIRMAACRIRGEQSATSPLIFAPLKNGTQLQRKHVASSELPTAIASWDMDGDALDGTASYDATLHGCGWKAGPSGYALDLDGTDDYADTGETFQSTFQASWSLEMFFRADDGRPTANEYLFGCGVVASVGMVAAYINPTGYIYFTIQVQGTQKITGSTGSQLPNGDTGWQHVVFVVNGTTSLMYIYLNGVLYDTADDISALTLASYAQNTEDLVLGAYNESGVGVGYFFDGKIANVKLYDAAITATQALALYNNIWFKEVTNEKPFKLPRGMHESHSYKFLGNTEIETFDIAPSMDELD